MNQDLLNHSLNNLYLAKQGSMREVVANLLGLQAQFNANPYYSLKIRSYDYNEETIISDYVKTWSFRGTIHCVHKDDLALHLSARHHTQFTDHWNMKANDKPFWSTFILDQIKQGHSTRKVLKEMCLKENMNEKHFESVFHGWGGLLQEMCLMGLIAYKPTNNKEFIVLDKIEWMDVKSARAKVIEQYFESYGPATINDCAYFTKYKITEIKQLMKEFHLELDTYKVERKEYFYKNKNKPDSNYQEIVLLAGFDPLILGYQDKSRFLDEAERFKYVTNTGIIFPGILINGRLAARWQKTPKGIIVKPYKKILVKHKKMIEKKLRQTFDGALVTFDSEIIC